MTNRLTLYSRQYCHLCHDMLAALDALRGEHVGLAAFEVEVIDVDTDPALEAKYGDLVPVLEAEGRELCHYFLDVPKVLEYLG